MEKLNNICCCYEGFAPFTKGGGCRFCFGLSPNIVNNNINQSEKTSIFFDQYLITKQKIINLIKNKKDKDR